MPRCMLRRELVQGRKVRRPNFAASHLCASFSSSASRPIVRVSIYFFLTYLSLVLAKHVARFVDVSCWRLGFFNSSHVTSPHPCFAPIRSENVGAILPLLDKK